MDIAAGEAAYRLHKGGECGLVSADLSSCPWNLHRRAQNI